MHSRQWIIRIGLLGCDTVWSSKLLHIFLRGFCTLYFPRRKSIILILVFAGNELTFSCPATALPIGQKGWTGCLKSEEGEGDRKTSTWNQKQR